MADVKIGNFYAELSLISPKLSKNKAEAVKELEDLEKKAEGIMKEAGEKMTREFKIELSKLEQNKEEVKKKLKEIEDEASKVSNAMQQAGQLWVSYITDPIKDFVSSSVETFAQFEQSMQNTFSVMGASESEMELLTQTAQKMGETTRFSASQAAEALYSLGSAGQSAGEAVNSLQGVLRLAGATGSDLAYTSETIASTLSQFNLQAGKASHVADVFAKAISKSQANIGKLSYSMKYVGPVASGLGISLETTTAALMKLYNTGYGGEQAGTYLRQAFQKLASGTENFKKKLSDLGIAYEDVNPQTRNFADILNTLKDHNIGVTEAIAIFGETAGGAMAKLIEEGGDVIRTFDGMLQSSEGAAEEMQKIQNTSFANTKAELSSAFEAVQISVGSVLIPAIDVIAKGITKILQAVNSLPVGMKTFITCLLVAGAAIGPLMLLPSMIKAATVAMNALNISMSANPIFAVAAVIAVVAAAAYALYNQVKANTQELADQAKKNMDELKETMNKANEAAAKAQTLDELISKYDSLKSKTNRTKKEQEEYNNTLHRLVELVPGVITEIDATGNAFIMNIEKIRKARNEQLLIEKQQNALALQQAENIEKQDQLLEKQLQAQERRELNAYRQKRNKATGILETDSLTKLQRAEEVLDSILYHTEAIEDANTYEELKTLANNLNFLMPLFTWDVTSIKENLYNQLNNRVKYANQVMEIKNEIERQRIEIQKRAVEKQKLLSKQQLIENLGEQNKNKEPESRKAIVSRVLKEGEKAREDLNTLLITLGRKKSNRVTKSLQKELEILEEYMVNKIPNMIKGVDITESFNWELDADNLIKDDELVKIQKRLEEINKDLNTSKGTSTPKPKPEEEEKKSLDERLQLMDEGYKKQLELAKKYGKNEFLIALEWYNKRRELLEEEIGKSKKTREEALQQTTGGKDGRETITIADEYEQTDQIRKLWETKLETANREYNEKKAELDAIIEEISTLKEANITEDGNILLNQQIEEAEEKAKKLAGELEVTYMTQKDLDELVDSFNNKREATFVDHIKDIKTKEKNAIQNIQSSLGLDDEAKKKAIDEIIKKSKYATAVVSTQLIQSISSVGVNFTNMLLNSIETSKDGLDASMKMITGMMAQVQDLIPEPITKAVIGTILAVYNIIDQIANYSKKKEEERRKKTAEAQETAHKKELERAKEIAGDSAKEYGKVMSATFKTQNFSKNIFDERFDKMLNKNVDDVLAKLGEAETDLKKWVESGYWTNDWHWDNGILKKGEHWVDTSKYEVKTMNELWAEYYKARKKGDDKEAKRIEADIERNTKRILKLKGLREEDINGLYRYLGDVRNLYTQAIQAGDLSTIGVSFKEKIREAIVEKLKSRMFEGKMKELINRYEKNPTQSSLKDIIEEAEQSAKMYEKEMQKLAGALGVANSEMDEHIKKWAGMKKAITDSLSSSLGESAYNADWSSFKKAFASEMKKAIIEATLTNAKVKTNIDRIIKGIMKDGKITEGEIDKSIKELREYYDAVEGELAPFSKITQALEKGVEIKNETKGSVIQKLSGADRDWFTEVLREGFENMVKAFNLSSVSFKEIHATQIIIQQATLSVSTVNIYAKDNYSLKELIAEMIREAKANAG